MRTYSAEYQTSWGDKKTVAVAAPSFLEAWKKVKRLMRATTLRCTLLSIVQTAKLNA